MQFSAMWMDLASIMLNKIRERLAQAWNDLFYKWDKKKHNGEIINAQRQWKERK